MIDVIDYSKCSGCYACINACTRDAIHMEKREDWHLYPFVDLEKCIDCGQCDLSCPYLNEDLVERSEGNPTAFASYNKDPEVRIESTSGGVFTILAENIIFNGGVVCAAKFDKDWKVVHGFAYSKEDLVPFRKSKYVQSDISLSYREIKKQLVSGKSVLFVGLPCQVSGLKHYLKKDYDRLLTLDLICMGIASPFIWEGYLKGCEGKNIRNITFKDKTIGWWHSDWRMIIEFNGGEKTICKGRDNMFMYGYLDRMYFRPSCYSCLIKQRGSYSDITIGDAWGYEKINPKFLDNKGASVIILNTDKGKNTIENVRHQFEMEDFPYDDVVRFNKYYRSSAPPSQKRRKFYELLNSKGLKEAMQHCCMDKTLKSKLLRWLRK